MNTATFSEEKVFKQPGKIIRRQAKFKSRAERNIAIMNEIKNLIGDDIPWASEEEMIKELAEMRRQRMRS